MYYYAATIQYDGTGYAGFQWQRESPTIQGAINGALAKLLSGKHTLRVASRTDTGVHAYEQVLRICSSVTFDCHQILLSLNRTLPSQIRCLELMPSTKSFCPSINVASKEYRYLFTNVLKVKKEEMRFVANIANRLDLEKMKVCVEALVGAHDFINFYSSGSNVKSSVREIFECDLSLIEPATSFGESSLFVFPRPIHNCYQLRIVGNGFLKQMIRHIVGALWLVGSGKLSIIDFKNLLDGEKIAKRLWKVAPPNGLFLYQIKYHQN